MTNDLDKLKDSIPDNKYIKKMEDLDLSGDFMLWRANLSVFDDSKPTAKRFLEERGIEVD